MFPSIGKVHPPSTSSLKKVDGGWTFLTFRTVSELTGAIILPLIGAALHPFLGVFIQRCTKAKLGLTLIVAFSNLITAVIFALYLKPEGGWALHGKDWLAVLNGILFFTGQWFSARSLKSGDLAVHSSAMGVKLIIVATLATAVGLETSRPFLIPAALLACVSVFMVAGGSIASWREHWPTVGFTLLACVFFGLNDFMTGWQAREIGAARWLVILFATGGVLSLGLLAARIPQIKELAHSGTTKWFLLAAGATLGVQALIVNIAFSEFRQPTLSNVAYSTRGVMAVIFLWCLGQRKTGGVFAKQISGAVLMVVALILALQK